MPYMLVCLCCPAHYEATPEEYSDRDKMRLCPRCQAIYDTGRDPSRTIWPDEANGGK